MRAKTRGKHEMGKRFAVVIGVAAAGVMALGAQTAAQTTGDPVDSTPPDLQIWGPKKQSPQNAKPTRLCVQADPRCPWALDVRMSCGEGCSAVSATGKLTNVKMYKLTSFGAVSLQGGRPGAKVGPLLWDERQRREVRQALANGENVKAKVTVRVTDAVGQAAQLEFIKDGDTGNVATARRTITLVK
jgi:hypothetical protein